MIAALYVLPGGCYYGMPDVDPWDEARDARLYAGPHPVVAHPPCERWGRFADGGVAARGTATPGDDGGCFEAALASVRAWGGVIEHPAGSRAWAAHGLAAPPPRGWVSAVDWAGGLTCAVEQGHYGHRARKATWLYYVGEPPEPLIWGPSAAGFRPPEGLDEDARRRFVKTGTVQRLSRKQRKATPPAFRDVLLALARGSR